MDGVGRHGPEFRVRGLLIPPLEVLSQTPKGATRNDRVSQSNAEQVDGRDGQHGGNLNS